jgi:hypothetical protein
MTATLPSALLVNHIMADAEWNQIITALASMSNVVIFNTNAATASTLLTTYVNVTGGSTAYTKLYDSSTSDVGALFFCSARTGTSNASITFAINDGTTDWEVTHLQQLTANKHYYQAGFARMTGLAAGAYTMAARIKHSTTATAATIDSNDTLSMLFIELPK